jgi:hypothetical protein
MPDAPKKPFDVARTFNNGPDIKVILPVLNKEYKVPVRLVVRFIPQNSKEVDISKFKVECLKFISINITEKILPYTTKEGITMENAQLPAGQYTFRLTIGDVAGGITQETFQVKVVD